MIKVKTNKGKFLYFTKVMATGTPTQYCLMKGPQGGIKSAKLLDYKQFQLQGKVVQE